jgi:hypothetical protein
MADIQPKVYCKIIANEIGDAAAQQHFKHLICMGKSLWPERTKGPLTAKWAGGAKAGHCFGALRFGAGLQAERDDRRSSWAPNGLALSSRFLAAASAAGGAADGTSRHSMPRN